jgi:hypothetical protein
MTARLRQAEHQRLERTQERLQRRLEWAADQRDAATERLDTIADELAIVVRQLDALEAER